MQSTTDQVWSNGSRGVIEHLLDEFRLEEEDEDVWGYTVDQTTEVAETAWAIFQRARDDGLLVGRNRRSIIVAAVYHAARTHGNPLSPLDLADHCPIDAKQLSRDIRYLSKEMALQTPPPEAIQYLDRYGPILGLSEDSRADAQELLEAGEAEGLTNGRSPSGIAAAACYAAAKRNGENVRQIDVAKESNVSTVTIRERYKELVEAAGWARESVQRQSA